MQSSVGPACQWWGAQAAPRLRPRHVCCGCAARRVCCAAERRRRHGRRGALGKQGPTRTTRTPSASAPRDQRRAGRDRLGRLGRHDIYRRRDILARVFFGVSVSLHGPGRRAGRRSRARGRQLGWRVTSGGRPGRARRPPHGARRARHAGGAGQGPGSAQHGLHTAPRSRSRGTPPRPIRVRATPRRGGAGGAWVVEIARFRGRIPRKRSGQIQAAMRAGCGCFSSS